MLSDANHFKRFTTGYYHINVTLDSYKSLMIGYDLKR